MKRYYSHEADQWQKLDIAKGKIVPSELEIKTVEVKGFIGSRCVKLKFTNEELEKFIAYEINPANKSLIGITNKNDLNKVQAYIENNFVIAIELYNS
jgi:hypothetical protein